MIESVYSDCRNQCEHPFLKNLIFSSPTPWTGYNRSQTAHRQGGRQIFPPIMHIIV